MTLRELEQYRDIEAEIAEDRARLNTLSDSDYDDLYERIRAKTERRNAKLRRCYIFIERIPDAYTRRIFKLRFIDGLSWNKLAHIIGGTTADAARMAVKRYLREKNT